MKVTTYLWEAAGSLLDPIVAIIIALTLGAVVVSALGNDVGLAYRALFKGAFGNLRSLTETLLATTPLLLTGLAFGVAFRCGLFNIGIEGQLYIGSIVGAYVGFTFSGLPPLVLLPLTLAAGAAAGAAWGFLPGLLKAKVGAHEVINTIMMNYIAIHLTSYLVGPDGPLRAPGELPATPWIAEGARLAKLVPGTRLNTGIFIALGAAVLVWVILWKSRQGYKIRAVGLNPLAAEYAGINVSRSIITAMMLSGCLAGLAGIVEVAGLHYRFYDSFSPGYGFDAIAVSLLGANHPVGIALAALLFGALKTGAMSMQVLAGTNRELVRLLQSLVIFFVAAKWSVITILQWKARKEGSIDGRDHGSVKRAV
ncbi:ABC transporter permease [Neomoorella glycerini]|nr:ABC transporter permease [Moorella glycerini]